MCDSLERRSPGKCLNLPYSLNSKESSNEAEQSYFPVLSQNPYGQGDHCCSPPFPGPDVRLAGSSEGPGPGDEQPPGASRGGGSSRAAREAPGE